MNQIFTTPNQIKNCKQVINWVYIFMNALSINSIDLKVVIETQLHAGIKMPCNYSNCGPSNRLPWPIDLRTVVVVVAILPKRWCCKESIENWPNTRLCQLSGHKKKSHIYTYVVITTLTSSYTKIYKILYYFLPMNNKELEKI